VGYYGVVVAVVVLDFLVFAAFAALVFLVFVVAVVGAASSANTGIASEKITIDANRTVRSFFMVGLDLLRFVVRYQ
jgi:hypothetical protein